MENWLLDQIKYNIKQKNIAWEKGDKKMHTFYHGAEEAYIEMLKKYLEQKKEEQ